MIFLVWTGPVPRFHAHGTLDSYSTIAATECQTQDRADRIKLQIHLTRFHDDMDLRSEHWFGWHLHWVYGDGDAGFPVDETTGYPPMQAHMLVQSEAELSSSATSSDWFVGDFRWNPQASSIVAILADENCLHLQTQASLMSCSAKDLRQGIFDCRTQVLRC